jgi:predicted AlkP superfamily pyrophosphatase or phosphodiesterase
VYLGCVDIVGHMTGPLSTEYGPAIERVDAMVGELLDAIARRRTFVPSLPDDQPSTVAP